MMSAHDMCDGENRSREVTVTANELHRIYSVVENSLYGGVMPTNEILAMYLGEPVTELQPYVHQWFRDFGPAMGNLSAMYSAAELVNQRSVITLPCLGSDPRELGARAAGSCQINSFLSEQMAFAAIVKCWKLGMLPSISSLRELLGDVGSDARIRRCIASWANRFAARAADDVRTARMAILTRNKTAWEYHVQSRIAERGSLH
ncbi:hypothetical protein LMG31884_46680 (plasmid) [Xanthomonas hydrangeae]|nr:hypothetical protein LMG31884_46680 [Xanthomonas hydrangeae]CAD7740453.1 hypothetical protein LMG31884_46680 [Xanthomonas hydrangeae]